MKEWQKEYIINNLTELTEITICNVSFITALRSARVLSDEEYQLLKRTRDREGYIACSKTFYDIVSTKSAYDKIVAALRSTKQSEAEEILVNGYEWSKNWQPSNWIEGRKEICFNVRQPIPEFAGRQYELQAILEMLKENISSQNGDAKSLAIVGLGGVGKTQVCLQFIQNSKTFYDFIIWLDADSENILEQMFYTLADNEHIKTGSTLANKAKKPINIVLSEIFNLLSKKISLVIFDNVDRKDALTQFLPENYVDKRNSHISVIITSRLSHWDERYFNVIPLSGLDDLEAVEFVQNALNPSLSPEEGNSEADVRKLVKLLSDHQGKCFPLAMQQAVSYLKHKQKTDHTYTVQKYNKEFATEEKRGCMLGNQIDNGRDTYQKTTSTTWKITINTISTDQTFGRLAVHLLQIISQIYPETIKRDMFFNLADKTCSTGNTEIKDNVKEAINLLVSYSLISAENNQTILNVHRLVQDVTRYNMNKKEATKISIDTLKLLHTLNYSQNLNHITCAWNFAARDKKVVRRFYSSSVYTSKLTPLHLLCNLDYGDYGESVKALLDNVTRWNRVKIVNIRDGLKRSPLWWAAESGNLQALEILIQENANPFMEVGHKGEYLLEVEETYGPTAFGYTALHIAARNGHLECVKLLLQHFPKLKTIKNYYSETAALIAIKRGFLEIAKLLLPETNPDVLKLMVAIWDLTKLDEFKENLLRLSKEDRDQMFQSGFHLGQALDISIRNNYPNDFISFLVESGAKVRKQRTHCPLHTAAQWGCERVARHLVLHGAHPTNDMNQDGYTPLHVACQNGRVGMVKFMSTVDGVDIEKPDDKGDTPLHVAAFHGHLQVVKFLLDNGVNINCRDRAGFTPILAAAFTGYFQIVEYILANCNSVELKMRNVPENQNTFAYQLGLTLLHPASAYGQLDLVKRLISNFKLDDADNIVSPLHLAVLFNQSDVVKYFIDMNRESVSGNIEVEKVINAALVYLEDETIPFSNVHILRMLRFFRRYPTVQKHFKLTPASMSQFKFCEDGVKEILRRECSQRELNRMGLFWRMLNKTSVFQERVKFLQIAAKAKINENDEVLLDYDSMVFYSQLMGVK